MFGRPQKTGVERSASDKQKSYHRVKCDMLGFVQRCMARYCELSVVKEDSDCRYPCFGRQRFTPEQWGAKGEPAPRAAPIVMNMLYDARVRGWDRLPTISWLMGHMTKWGQLCGAKLMLCFACLQSTGHSVMQSSASDPVHKCAMCFACFPTLTLRGESSKQAHTQGEAL